MICSKCNATIPDGSTSCPQCHAKFEKHVGSFAGSVHWEDEVKQESAAKRRGMIIFSSIILALAVLFWILVQTGAMGQIILALQRFINGLS